MNDKTLTYSARLFKSILMIVATLLVAGQRAETQTTPTDEFAVLVDGLGNYSRKISTNSERAQKFFDQGLRLGMSSRTHARHAWDFMRYAAMQEGNYAKAMEAAKAAAAGQSHQGMGGSERTASMPWLIHMVFGNWMRFFLSRLQLTALRIYVASGTTLEVALLSGWALFGLRQSLEAQKRFAEAGRVQKSFERAWKGADITLKASVF